MNEDEKNFCRNHFHNYTRHNVFRSNIFADEWDYVILSFLDDMTYKIYEHKSNPNLRVLLYPNRNHVHGLITNISQGTPASKNQKRLWFDENFAEGHYITPERFEENLLWIASKVPAKTKIILINGPELDFFNHPERLKQITALNKVIKRVCETHGDKFSLVDTNKVIRVRDDVTNFMFHLKAQTAFSLFTKIADAMIKLPPRANLACCIKFLTVAKFYCSGKILPSLKSPTTIYHWAA